MAVLLDQDRPLSPWIRRELDLSKTLRRSASGRAVRLVQEWLNLRGQRVAIDGDYGPATAAAVRAFQRGARLKADGVVGPKTYAALLAPLYQVLAPLPAGRRSFAELTLAYARRHLAQHPLEIGGQNRGPWVRLYMQGEEGNEWAWCAGFVSFVMQQAAESLGVPMPIAGSVSCDTLAAQARDAERFVAESELKRGTVKTADLPVASVFLVRRTSSDWTHAGLVSAYASETFATIEGNTNDQGSREGYEVCARTRGYAGKDFIRL